MPQPARIFFSDGTYYPSPSEYKPDDELPRIYDSVLQYSKIGDDLSSGTQLTRNLFKDFYSMLYFDLRYSKSQIVTDTRDLSFQWTLDAASGADYYVYAMCEYYYMILFLIIWRQFVAP